MPSREAELLMGCAIPVVIISAFRELPATIMTTCFGTECVCDGLRACLTKRSIVSRDIDWVGGS